MKNTEILIIGAGASGLMAAYTLAKAGKKVMILEARNRAGGRIHTLRNESFFSHAELGAEFVHGNLPVTLKLLKEANIAYHPAHGEMWQYDNGKFNKEYQQADHWDLLMKELGGLEQDISIGDFLQQHFAGDQYTHLRRSVSKFVAGYDTADPFKASAFALRNEWQNEDEGAQYRIDEGYSSLINYLVDENKAHGVQLFLNTVAKKIHWENRRVEVKTASDESYFAEKVIVALPAGVLQATAGEMGAISFSPSVPRCEEAIRQVGFGAIIKILLEFKNAFWEDEETTRLAGRTLKKMGFLLSDEEIPTWVPQVPKHSTVLTGWLGGPPAERKRELSNEELLQQGLQSLANIFKRDADELKDSLVAWNIVNWTTDPFTCGSYSYDMVATPNARKILNEPISHTIYFAGEYLYDGPAMGTVEAALTSGLQAANNILR